MIIDTINEQKKSLNNYTHQLSYHSPGGVVRPIIMDSRVHHLADSEISVDPGSNPGRSTKNKIKIITFSFININHYGYVIACLENR